MAGWMGSSSASDMSSILPRSNCVIFIGDTHANTTYSDLSFHFASDGSGALHVHSFRAGDAQRTWRGGVSDGLGLQYPEPE
jgi:hypothetical protein